MKKHLIPLWYEQSGTSCYGSGHMIEQGPTRPSMGHQTRINYKLIWNTTYSDGIIVLVVSYLNFRF